MDEIENRISRRGPPEQYLGGKITVPVSGSGRQTAQQDPETSCVQLPAPCPLLLNRLVF